MRSYSINKSDIFVPVSSTDAKKYLFHQLISSDSYKIPDFQLIFEPFSVFISI